MMRNFLLVLCSCLIVIESVAQVSLPYQANFRDANAKTIAQSQWQGPWDKSLRCDAMDTLRFLPTCCNRSENVPFLGIWPFAFYCDHRKTASGGDYLSLMRNYNWSSVKTTVCDSIVLLSPKLQLSTDSLPVLALLASKNNVSMTYQTWPQGPQVPVPIAAAYTALEVTLVDSANHSLGLVDTLEISDGFAWHCMDVARFKQPSYRGFVRFKLRFLGDGNIGIDEIRMYHSPKISSSLTASCAGKDGKIVIDSVIGFVAPFTYQWSTGDKQAFIDSLNAGRYFVVVQDAQGRLAKREFQLASVLQVTVDSLTAIDTSGNPGTVVLGYGGAKPMKWSWSSALGFQSTQEKPSFYQPAKYQVSVMDSAGCMASVGVAMGIKCHQVYTPYPWVDTLCAGNFPKFTNAPFPSLWLRFWTTPNDSMLLNAKGWQGIQQGLNIRYGRWIDTINGCVGKAGEFSLYLRSKPVAPAAKDWLECQNNLGFTHSWEELQQNKRLYWRQSTQTTWLNQGLPKLSPTETNDPKGQYVWVGKYKDTITGCYSDTAISSYLVKSTVITDLEGTANYQYGTTSTLRAKGLPSGSSKRWTISYGGVFEMLGPGGNMHPCNGKKDCISSDSVLVVRHSVVPCWTPPRVVSSVELVSVSNICTAKSKLYAEDTGAYDCFGTQLLPVDTLTNAVEGETLMVKVPTTAGYYHVINDPLHMQYGTCNFYLPYHWQIQWKDSLQWLPLNSVLDTAFSTKTDTHEIQLKIPKATLKLDQAKVKLILERCEGLYSESAPQRISIHPDTGDYRVFPNPASDQIVIRPSTNQEVKIYNIYGRLQFKGLAHSAISTKDWDEGVYSVQIVKGGAVKTISKLVVLH